MLWWRDPLIPVDQRPAERRAVSREPVDRVLDEVGGAWIVLYQVDKPFGDLLDQQYLPATHTPMLTPGLS